MRKRATLIALTAIAILISSADRLPAFTETMRVHDDEIYVDDGSGDPNAPPVGDANAPCPRTTADMRPALLFIECDTPDERLYVSWFSGGAIQNLEIASAKDIQVTQLDHAIFLVRTSGGSTDRGVFVIDLDRGVGRQIARSTRIGCLRSVPERGKAMLIHCDFDIDEARYLELDLATLRLTLSRTFNKADLGDKFIGTSYGTALSPDFEQAAYMAGYTPWGLRWSYDFRLTLLNLSTMQESVLDEHVGIEVPPMSSSTAGWVPPLEWINDGEIVYRHMPPLDVNDPNWVLEPLCAFKRVDIVTGRITTISQERLRWVDVYGSLKLNPLNGELIYGNQWVLDPEKGTLTPAIRPFSVVNEREPERAKVFLREELLQVVDGMVTSTLISALHQNLAYVLHPADADPNTILYVKIADAAEPIEVAERSCPIIPAGWIE
jgi:hypothetical protein